MLVTVVGAGVSGLSTAVALEEAGHHVRVIAREKGDATTSAAAGAIWYPFRADPPDRVNRWASRTREYLAELAASAPQSGVDVLTLYELVDDDSRPWWAESAGELRHVRASDSTPFPLPSRGAWVFRAPRIVPALHLAWLESQLAAPIEIRAVESLDAVPGDMVVNCTGLGARQLCGDTELLAVFGQTVVVEGLHLEPGLVISDERDPDEIFYAIPRRGEVLLGGCAIDCDDDRALEPGPVLRDAILARARRLGFEPGALLRERCGLRPYRSSVRVERDGRIVHNYGHGGAGYTLARGCAEEVLELVARHD
ncbi:MAG: FAD-dependent oxidoreductase [Dehalococcoidia bacterium]